MAFENDDRADWFNDVGPGWRPLLVELDAELLTTWPNYRITQVKEKFGTLRFYASPHPGPSTEGWAQFDATIRKYEERSATICEQCGAPGTLRDGPWVKTHCDPCHLAHKSRELAGYHADEWERFTISAPTFADAARVAATLGWWLHCWTWVEGDWGITDSQPEGGVEGGAGA